MIEPMDPIHLIQNDNIDLDEKKRVAAAIISSSGPEKLLIDYLAPD